MHQHQWIRIWVIFKHKWCNLRVWYHNLKYDTDFSIFPKARSCRFSLLQDLKIQQLWDSYCTNTIWNHNDGAKGDSTVTSGSTPGWSEDLSVLSLHFVTFQVFTHSLKTQIRLEIKRESERHVWVPFNGLQQFATGYEWMNVVVFHHH